MLTSRHANREKTDGRYKMERVLTAQCSRLLHNHKSLVTLTVGNLSMNSLFCYLEYDWQKKNEPSSEKNKLSAFVMAFGASHHVLLNILHPGKR